MKPAVYWRELTVAVPDLQLIEALGDLLPDGLLRIERVTRLVDVRQLHGLSELELAAVGGLLARDHPEQCRLAGPVRADHADDAGAGQVERQRLDQQPVAEALGEVGRGEHLLAEARARGDVDLDVLELHVALLGDQLLVAGQAGL